MTRVCIIIINGLLFIAPFRNTTTSRALYYCVAVLKKIIMKSIFDRNKLFVIVAKPVYIQVSDTVRYFKTRVYFIVQ